MPEQEVAHPHAALAEPPQGVLIEAPVPILIGEVDANALAELRRDAIRGFAESGERLAPRLTRAGQHGVDRRAHEPTVSAGRREDLDLSGGRATGRFYLPSMTSFGRAKPDPPLSRW